MERILNWKWFLVRGGRQVRRGGGRGVAVEKCGTPLGFSRNGKREGLLSARASRLRGKPPDDSDASSPCLSSQQGKLVAVGSPAVPRAEGEGFDFLQIGENGSLLKGGQVGLDGGLQPN